MLYFFNNLTVQIKTIEPELISNINTCEEGLYIDTLSREFIYLIFVQKG